MSDQPSPAPVWSKRVAPTSAGEAATAYCAGRDVVPVPAADDALAPYDLNTNAAHAIMLGDAGIISPADRATLLGALLKLREESARASLLIPAAEDIHMSIEARVTEMTAPGTGGRLHTARSRNDQVATDMRQWLRDEAAALAVGTEQLAAGIADTALAHRDTVCPGFTHMQPAMATTFGHWLASYLPRLDRALGQLESLLDPLSECPLGSAASYGANWPIDRQQTARLLGFDRPTPSTIDPIWSRGELEARYAFACAQLLGGLAGIGQDLILVSTPPRAWLRLSDDHVTGSSIMPQKRNPDVAEVTRAKAAVVAGIAQSLLSIGSGAAIGYNRDTQWTKYLVMDAAGETAAAPAVFADMVRGLEVDADAMRHACGEGFLLATDAADFLARTRGLAFRTCYRVVGEAVRQCEGRGALERNALNAALGAVEPSIEPLSDEEWRAIGEPGAAVSARTQAGGPSADAVQRDVEAMREAITTRAARISARADAWNAAIDALWVQAGVLSS